MPQNQYLSICLIFLFSQCSKHTLERDFNTLNQHKKLWTEKQILNYQVTQSIDCNCPEAFTKPKTIEVRNKKIVAIDGRAVTQDYIPYKTIDTFFEFIKEKMEKYPAELKLNFNPQFGYPKYLYFDMDKSQSNEEIRYTLTDFKILN